MGRRVPGLRMRVSIQQLGGPMHVSVEKKHEGWTLGAREVTAWEGHNLPSTSQGVGEGRAGIMRVVFKSRAFRKHSLLLSPPQAGWWATGGSGF